MTSDLDIFRTATVLIREHGQDAALAAAQRADTMLEKGCLGLGNSANLPSFRGAAVKEIWRRGPQCRPPIRNLGRRCLRVPGKSRHPCRVFGPASN